MGTSTDEKLAEIEEWVDSFCDLNHIPSAPYSEEYEHIMNLESKDIYSLNSEECNAHAIQLMNYASYLYKRLTYAEAKLDWCNKAVDNLCAQKWSQFDKWMPGDVKKQACINESSMAQEIEGVRIKLESTKKVLSSSYHDLKRRVALFENLGKVKYVR